MRIAPAAVTVAAHAPTGTRRRICALRDHVRGRRRKTAIACQKNVATSMSLSLSINRLCGNHSPFSDGRVGIHHRGVSRRAVACSRVCRQGASNALPDAARVNGSGLITEPKVRFASRVSVNRYNMVVKVQAIVWPDATAVPSTADLAAVMTSFLVFRLFANAHARLIGCAHVCRAPEGKRNGMSPSKQLQLCDRMREL